MESCLLTGCRQRWMSRSLPGKATFRHSQIASCHFINSKYPHLNQAGKENIYACLSGRPSFFFRGSQPGYGSRAGRMGHVCRPFGRSSLMKTPGYPQDSSGQARGASGGRERGAQERWGSIELDRQESGWGWGWGCCS